MSAEPVSNPIPKECLAAAIDVLSRADLGPSDLAEASMEVLQFIDHASQANVQHYVRGGESLCQLIELAATWIAEFENDALEVVEVIEFTIKHLQVMQDESCPDTHEGLIEEFVDTAEQQWGECFELVDLPSFDTSTWDANDLAEKLPSDEAEIPAGQIELLLSALSGNEEVDPANEQTEPLLSEDVVPSSTLATDAQARRALVEDREMLEAFLDDANRCLESMEKAAFAFEEDSSEMDAVEQFCRDLHTLKGASATVGLSELAGELHELESSLEALFKGDATTANADSLFSAVDRIRNEIASLDSTPNSADSTNGSTNVPRNDSASSLQVDSTPRNVERPNFSHDESSIRIRASKLDRLMDMLAELVVLRNRRDNHVSEFNAFNDELVRCATRLSTSEQNYEHYGLSFEPSENDSSPTRGRVFSEVGKDIEEVASGLKELQKPVANDNHAISAFIRDFRQELMQLRRVPVSGLFQRLQRAARDAAKSEGKQVQINLLGEQAGLEQEIQERLYESLLHVVRNSVSHGIQPAAERLKSGKSEVGTLTLEATSSAQLLIIEVRDDGAGINHDAILRRAIEKGIVAPHEQPSKTEIEKFVFLPGFSTRETASAVSGRGVGMNIVARTIEELRGRIDISSVDGKGTTIRILIPLSSGIEHVMVFRSSGQLFALPMQSVSAAKNSNSKIGEFAKISLGNNDTASEKNGPRDVLVLRNARPQSHPNGATDSLQHSSQTVALEVDELVGPEEVVVRSLPVLLRNHPLFAGVSLSGSGEKVLLLNNDRLLDFCEFRDDPNRVGKPTTEFDANREGPRTALVVDDSLTARKALTKLLVRQGFQTTESGDGLEAIQRLHERSYDVVFTDLDMPRFGGLELLSDIQRGSYCDAPVVVVSSRTGEAFQSKALDAGAADFLAKPITANSLKQLLLNVDLLTEPTER